MGLVFRDRQEPNSQLQISHSFNFYHEDYHHREKDVLGWLTWVCVINQRVLPECGVRPWQGEIISVVRRRGVTFKSVCHEGGLGAFVFWKFERRVADDVTDVIVYLTLKR